MLSIGRTIRVRVVSLKLIPLGMSAASLADPQTLKMYSYVGNDPVNRVDPDAQFWVRCSDSSWVCSSTLSRK